MAKSTYVETTEINSSFRHLHLGT